MTDEVCIDRFIPGKCIPRAPDQVIRALAERQHGVIARRQLIAAGVSRHAIDLRLQRGRLCPIHSGVYAVGHLRLSFHGRSLAAVLACGPDATLSHRSAGRLWRLIDYANSAGTEVTRPRGFRARPGVLAHCAALPEDEVEVVEGIPVTSVSRTIFDLAAVVARSRLEKAINEAEVLGLTSRLSLPELLDRHPRRRGSTALRGILQDDLASRGVTLSELEERFAALVDRYELPSPRHNVTLPIGGRHPMVDCLWQDERLIVELDGQAVHATSRAFEADRERDRLLVGAGWRVVRLTWRQLRDEPQSIAAELRGLLDGPAQAA